MIKKKCYFDTIFLSMFFLFVITLWVDCQDCYPMLIGCFDRGCNSKLYIYKSFNLSYLRYFPNLKILYLNNKHIKHIFQLENMFNVETLELSNNQITDISPLKNLTNLKILYLNSNQITDIFPLRNLVNLRQLRVDDNPIPNNQITEMFKIFPFMYYPKFYVRRRNIIDCYENKNHHIFHETTSIYQENY